MEFLTDGRFKVLSNPRVASVQLLSPHNSGSTHVTVTRVAVAPGAEQALHIHASSEQIRVAVLGSGTLFLAEGETHPFCAGDVTRFADGDLHGFRSTGGEPIVYLSVTSPPIDFSYAYAQSR